ncbi:MAG: phospho-sugar mutase [Marinifilaceae bacterium]
MNTELINKVGTKAKEWLSEAYDSKTRQEVEALINAEDNSELIDSFYKDLEFGTGGLRGIMGAGSNRMNIYTVGAATQGLANYINKVYPNREDKSVCIGHDCRNNSRLYAETVANIFSANGIKAYLFEDLRPTPEMSYCIRELGSVSGVIITASHNPKEYNGYKAYWEDGGQLVTPHDTNVINEVAKVKAGDIKFAANKDLIEILSTDIDKQYLDKVKTISLSAESIKRQHDLKIVFTPIHGTTVKLVPDSLKNWGFSNVFNVPEQDVIDGNFPTVWSANPEEPEALVMAINKAKDVDAELVMACDPDGDRLGISVKNDKNEWTLINGNQTALLFTWYIIHQKRNLNLLEGGEYMIKTIVTTELIKEICDSNKIECYDVYTGFKWIAAKIAELDADKYIGGGEESFGYMPAAFTRDKDAVASCSLMAEIAAWAKDNGKTLFDLLRNIYLEHGYSKEKMVYIVRKGISGAEEISNMMKEFRANPPKEINGKRLAIVKDYQTLEAKNLINNTIEHLDFITKSNVLQFFLEDGTKISVRPSGTEPKIKFYFEIKDKMETIEQYHSLEEKSDKIIDSIMKELGL